MTDNDFLTSMRIERAVLDPDDTGNLVSRLDLAEQNAAMLHDMLKREWKRGDRWRMRALSSVPVVVALAVVAVWGWIRSV